MVGMVVPLVSTCLGVMWGLGFCGFLGYNLEPLTLVIPLLIAARALSHSVQVTERYFECYDELGDVKAACVESASSILPPGLLGITTDALGIFLIAVAPIPIMQKMAYICGFWASSIVFTGLVFTPLLISFFKPPKNIPLIFRISSHIFNRDLSKCLPVHPATGKHFSVPPVHPNHQTQVHRTIVIKRRPPQRPLDKHLRCFRL